MLEGVITQGEQEVDRAITSYSDTVREICMLHLKSYVDTEDILQKVFSKYVLHSGSFESSEHEGAWIIRVTINARRDHLKSFLRSHTAPLEEITEAAGETPKEYSEVLEAVLSLPKKYKGVVYLFYCEDYTAVEISEIFGRNVDTVYTLLACAKVMLREMLRGNDFE